MSWRLQEAAPTSIGEQGKRLELLKFRSLEEGSLGARTQTSEEGVLAHAVVSLGDTMRLFLQGLEKLQSGSSCYSRKAQKPSLLECCSGEQEADEKPNSSAQEEARLTLGE